MEFPEATNSILKSLAYKYDLRYDWTLINALIKALMPKLEFKHVKCVLVGDGAVGKGCFIKTVATNVFPNNTYYSGKLFEEHLHHVELRDGQVVSVKFCYTRKFLFVWLAISYL